LAGVFSLNKKPSFLWGVATSSYQVEGGIVNNDWDFFTRSKSIRDRISNMTKPSFFYKDTTEVILQPAEKAVKFWDSKYYVNDFQLAHKLGMNTFRISLEWARIEPEKDLWNQNAINHYRDMIKMMIDEGLNPVVTLNHITLPLWVLTPPSKFEKKIGQSILPSPLKDIPFANPVAKDPFWKSLRGWENYRTVQEFIKFVEKMVVELKDLVDYWITINEPVGSIIGAAYLAGLWPPGFVLDGNRAKMVLHNLIEAHVQAYDTITTLDDVDADGDGIPKKVGFAHLMMAINPAEPTKMFGITIKDNAEAAKNFTYFVNDYFLNAVVNGEEDLSYLNTLQRYNKNSSDFIVHNNWKDKVDFIGLDYYRRLHVYYSKIVALSSAKFVGGSFINNLHLQKKKNQHYNSILNDLGWEIFPAGLYDIIMQIKKQWNNIPILITENGIADKSDKYRAPFMIAHLQQIKQAIDNGANIIGYLHWSLMDNYEWHEGYRPESKFGLFSIKHQAGINNLEFNRQMTNGAEAFELIIKESFAQNKDGVISDSAISKSKDKFGIFAADGSTIIKK
jgi:beta-glucosidase